MTCTTHRPSTPTRGIANRARRASWLPLTLISTLLLLPLSTARAADSVGLPFVQGETVRIIQGYNGGTHQGASLYGLDLVLAKGETSGATVLSPIDGSVSWAFEPGERTGCLEVVGRDGRFGVMLCHVLLDRPYARGEKVARGQPLGVVGAPGTVGNNGTAHVHMDLHLGGGDANPVPFSPPDGLLLEGVDLPATGAWNEHAGETLVSSNAIASPPPAAPKLPQPVTSTAARPARGCGPGVAPHFVFGFADLKAQLGDAMGDPISCEFPDPNGTGDVHQQTTRGLAFWRKSTNTPTFTNGFEHWGHTPAGWVSWQGASIDPPRAAL